VRVQFAHPYLLRLTGEANERNSKQIYVERTTPNLGMLEGWGRPTRPIEGQVGLTFERMIIMATERDERQTLPASPSSMGE
jgi:hypothetical protein